MGKSAGKIMPLPRGPYNENSTYNILDMVTLNNKLWIAKKSGIVGIAPSDDAVEWMLAVDGTTDVNALATEIYEKFDTIDANFETINTTFGTVDTRFEATNTSITENTNSISALDGRMTAAEESIANIGDSLTIETDSTAVKGSTKPITSGGVYNLFNSSDGLSYIKLNNSGETMLKSGRETKDGTAHYTMNTEVSIGNFFSVDVKQTPASDNSDSSITENRCRMGVSRNSVNMVFVSGSKWSYLDFYGDRVEPSYNTVYDLGSPTYKFRNIYATTGSIQTSDANEKEDIVAMDAEVAKNIIMGLNPVTFKFINGTSDRTHTGLIAQEVEELVNSLGIDNQHFAALTKSEKLDEEGHVIDGEYVYGLRYSEFVSILVKMCQNLQNEVDELKVRLGGA